jgi:hypothetical protein
MTHWMVDVWLALDGPITPDGLGHVAALVAAESTPRALVELCHAAGCKGRVGLRIAGGERPDPNEIVGRLVSVLSDRGVSARLLVPVVVVPFIAPGRVQTHAALEQASEALTDVVRTGWDYDDPLDEDQERLQSGLTDGMMRDAPWFELDPDTVSENFRDAWWADHLADASD